MDRQLSEHFKASEFACHDGCGFGLGENDVSKRLVAVLERVREHFGEPVTIMSGCRCAKHNASVGGAKNSQHMLGMAADIKVQGVKPEVVRAFLESIKHSGGLGAYRTFTHVDVRPYPARWTG